MVITYTGDGGSSEGDFYEGLNYAGVYKLPVIFFVQNNGYAITTPFSKQTAALSIAHKAVAAGIKGVKVDGMDVLAVIKAVRDVCRTRPQWRRRNAYRSCDIPFPSAFLSDDASKYRTKEEEGEWNEKDPIARLAKYLEAKGLWTEEDTARVKEEAKAKVNEQIKKQNKRKK